ncbi:hypothetical protein SCLCIDRAFT_21578 [Scleroderma citrinum Foug A]|uniref:Copper transporter n=1 Tax=Scleroderma citrinum Foug A TaxID=1036808 RepID=A0A0C3APA2_9AGAM|nr:hypothetical protein SCLCIDRAFT_21578 [Scleroderma citrinum Foug A]
MIQQPDPIPFHPLPPSRGLLHYLWSHYYQVGCAIIGLVVLLSGLAGALSLHVLFHSFACSSPPLPAKV